MKNLLFTLLFACAAFLTAEAQTFSLTPDSAWVAGPVDNTDIETHNDLANLTNGTRNIKWERTELVLNPGYIEDTVYTQVCDINACWGGHISTKTFQLPPGATTPMIIHLRNFTGQPANAVVQIKYTDLADPDNPQYSYYFLNSGVTSSNDLPAATVKLFPNPTAESFTLSNAGDVARVRVFGVDGRPVLNVNARTDSVYSIAEQPAGRYVVVLEAADGKVFQATQIVKN